MRFVFGLLLTAYSAFGAVETLYLDTRTDYAAGKPFGTAGPYERIVAKATLTSGDVHVVDIVKPRDPAKGNGTLVLLDAPGVPLEAFTEGGYTVLQVPDGKRDAMLDMLAFLRYQGSPFLLGDQKKFLKRTIVVAPDMAADHLRQELAAGTMVDEKRRPLFNAVVLLGKDAKGFEATGVKIVPASRDTLPNVVRELNSTIAR